MDDYKRRVRIEYKQPEQSALGKKPVGYMCTVHDADTGEEITNITDVVVYLRVSSINEAAITYYEKDDVSNHSKKTAISANPELDVLAMERHSWLETVVSQALVEVSKRCTERLTAIQYEEVQNIGAALISDIERHYTNP